jgi:glycogen debranching enzyme
MRITINAGTTFLISDKAGNVPEGTELGLYHEDTRFLSRYELSLDGQPPLALTAQASDPYAAVYFLTNRVLHGVPHGQLGIIRRRRVTDGLHEELEITNYGDDEAVFTIELVVDADFAHLFEVRRKVEVKAPPVKRKRSFRIVLAEEGYSLHMRYKQGSLVRRLAIHLSQMPARVGGGRFRYDLCLAPRQRWELRLSFLPIDTGVERANERQQEPRTSVTLQEQQEHEHAELIASMPHIETENFVLARAYEQSVRDFAALRIVNERVSEHDYAIAAGIPWFMTLFGRDSLIAAYQALPFYPSAAKGTLRALARLQGTQEDPLRAEEPGKILHEHRFEHFTGTQQGIPRYPYYGTIDATPLFLMLYAAVYRATGDLEFARSLRENAERALEWVDRYGDRDGDGYLEYIRGTDVGLDNQGWKDSWDSVRFRDGTVAQPPIALCEVQGYAYAARMGMAEVFESLGEPDRASGLRQQAARLKDRFNTDFWMADRGYYALALDSEKRQVDAITSNPGHLLWTGIADEEKAEQVARHLLSPDIFSGWGLRTMAASEGGYNPLSYHNGSIWPHDTCLAIAGLARYGFHEEAATGCAGLLRALSHYPDHRLPELFAGYSTVEAPIPVEYPTANRPQAWASGAVFMLLGSMIGLDVTTWLLDRAAYLPAGIRRLRLDGVLAGRRPVTVELVRGEGNRVTRAIVPAPQRDIERDIEREGPHLLTQEESNGVVA